MREAEAHLDETRSSWIAGHAPSDVFDYRVRSPVVIAERDHQCGVFLDHDTPRPFHVHTVLRTPHAARQRLRPGVGPAVAGARGRGR
jgi:uncharacterized protein DUF3500